LALDLLGQSDGQIPRARVIFGRRLFILDNRVGEVQSEKVRVDMNREKRVVDVCFDVCCLLDGERAGSDYWGAGGG
jgi:hypothetical protein